MKNKKQRSKVQVPPEHRSEKKIISLFKLNPSDIETSNTGENGEDVKLLSITAKGPFHIQQSVRIQSSISDYIKF